MSVSFECAEGAKLSNLDNYIATRSGYTFDGWYEGSTKYTTDSIMPSRNLNLTAKWSENTPVASTTYDLSVFYNISDDTDWFVGSEIFVNGVSKGTIRIVRGRPALADLITDIPIDAIISIYGKNKTSRTAYYHCSNATVNFSGGTYNSTYKDYAISSTKGIRFKVTNLNAGPNNRLSLTLSSFRPEESIPSKAYGANFYSFDSSFTLAISKLS